MEDIPGRFSFRKRSAATSAVKPHHNQSFPEIHINDLLKSELFSYSRQNKFLFSKEHSNSINPYQWLDTDSYQFPRYFKILLNVLFALCATPFCIIKADQFTRQRTGSVAVVYCTFIQKAVTAVIHCIVLVHCILTGGSMLKLKLLDKPSRVFEMTTTCSNIGLVIAFMYTWWRKQTSYQHLMNSLKTAGNNMPWKSIAILIGISSIPVIIFVGTIFNTAFALHNESVLQTKLASQLWNFWIRENAEINVTTEVISDPYLKFFGYTGIFINMWIMTLYVIIAEILVFVAAVSVWEITKKYKKIFESDTVRNLSLHQLSDLYLRMEKQIGDVNDCTGPIVLGWFLFAASFFLDAFFQMFSQSDIVLKVLSFLCILHYVAVLLVAANAHNTALTCKSILMSKGGHQSNSNSGGNHWSPAFVGYLEMSEVDVGVRGSEFFVISYRFLAATVCMLVTYLLIMLQFNLELPTPPPSQTPES